MGSFPTRQITLRGGAAALLRHAAVPDAAAILTLNRGVIEEGAFMVTEADEFLFTVAQEARWVHEHIKHPRQILLVVEREGGLIGVLNAEGGLRKRVAHRAVIGMSVAAAWRGQGVGSHLLNAAIDWAEAHPLIEKLSLAVLASNERALALYRKHDFIVEGRRVAEVRLGPGRYVDDVLMYRPTPGARASA